MLTADFNFYQSVYGGLSDEAAFNRLIKRAARICDYYCFGRIAKLGDSFTENTADNVKLAECAVFDKLITEEAQLQAHDGRVIASEGIGDKSESYVTPSAQELLTYNAQACYQAVKPYLIETGLMYRGFESEGDNLS